MFFLFAINLIFAHASPSDDCKQWFKDMDFSFQSGDCELQCASAPKNIVGAFCNCKDLCKARRKDIESLSQLIFIPGLNKEERKLIASNPQVALIVFKNQRLAENVAERHFPDGGHNDESDALRHFIWAGLLTIDLGKEKAQLYLNAHELSPQPANEKDMDNHNNDAGIKTAQSLITEKRATIENLEKEGLIKIKNNSLTILEPYNTKQGVYK